MRGISACYFLCILFSSSVCYAQLSRAELESRKRESHRRIAETERILDQVQSKREVSLGQLSALNSQMKSLEQLLSTLVAEVSYVSTEIGEVSRVALSLGEDLERLREEYARMIVWAYTHRMGLQQLVFLFSSKSFQQLYLRMRYLARFAEQRRTQLEAIEKVKALLEDQQKTLNTKRGYQEKLLNQQRLRRGKLLALQEEKQVLVSELGKKTKQLRQDLRTNREALKRLNTLIANLVKTESSRRSLRGRDVLQLTRSFRSSRKRDCLAGSGFCGGALWQAKSSGSQAGDR